MCGIFGIVSTAAIDPAVLQQAERIQKHRGPDVQQRSVESVGRLVVGLAHQRLAIIDLSPQGAQPMRSPSGRSVIIYNGEVYNYLELRDELSKCGVRFKTNTDTEVIAAACEEWGVERALQRFNGMWAFCWIDFHDERIVLARDRFGKKPLYLFRRGNELIFASEIKTILRCSAERFRVNAEAVANFLDSYQVDSTDSTFFDRITKLPAATFAVIDARNEQITVEPKRYWRLSQTMSDERSDSEWPEQLVALIDDAVRLRLRSDVPVGLLLSGGLDSSAAAASIAHQRSKDAGLIAITAVSKDKLTDESRYSRLVASHLGLETREVVLDAEAERLPELINTVTAQNDEPIGGMSIVAHYLLMQRAMELGIKVVLSGQGADEAFCGYRKYIGFQVLAQLRAGRPLPAAATLLGFACRGTLLPNVRLADAARYLPRLLRTTLPSALGPATKGYGRIQLGLRGSDVRERQISDFERFSVPALTHWEDRNSMAWSRELRNPFLDYRLVELGTKMPARLKICSGFTKHVLRKAVESRLPAEIVWRKEKRGFSTPEGKFLSGSLRPAVEAFLSGDSQAFSGGLVDRAAAGARFREFLARPGRWIGSREIFQWLSLDAWLRSYADVLSL